MSVTAAGAVCWNCLTFCEEYLLYCLQPGSCGRADKCDAQCEVASGTDGGGERRDRCRCSWIRGESLDRTSSDRRHHVVQDGLEKA